jgi:hypothetical protein
MLLQKLGDSAALVYFMKGQKWQMCTLKASSKNLE